MCRGWPFRSLIATAALSFCVAAGLGASWERALSAGAQDGGVLRQQAAGAEGEGESGSSQRLSRKGNILSARYGFTNFNGDRLEIGFAVPKKVVDEDWAEFGYRKVDLDAILAWHNAARQSIAKLAAKEHRTQEQLDRALAALEKEYDKRVKDYFSARGFKLLPGNTVEVDMTAIVRKNAPLLKPLALDFDRIAAERHYDSAALIGAVTSLAQTAIAYKTVPAEVGDVHIVGLLPPMTSLLNGWGNCDTKTGVIASVLANWPSMRMIGVGLPGHYLMGVLRIPDDHDTVLEYEGLQYALIEAAGPAWMPPGAVGPATQAMLQNPKNVTIDPFF